MLRLTVVPFLLAAGCASAEPLGEPDRKLLNDPATVHAFLLESFRLRHYSHAHKALSRGTKERLPYEDFYLAFASFEMFRGLFLRSEQHGPPVKTDAGARIRVCNPEYGFSEEFDLLPEFGGRLWVLDLTADQQGRLRRSALDWNGFQLRSAGDFYVYARDQRPPRRSPKCGCAGSP